MIRIVDDVVGPTVEKVTVTGDHVAVALRREPMTRADWTTHDYNVHFSVGIFNDGTSPVEAVIDVEGGDWRRLPDRLPLIYSAASSEGPWRRADFVARTNLKKRYAIRVPLAPGERAYIANTLPRMLAPLVDRFDALGAKSGAERIVYGRSLEGRDLVAYRMGDPPTKGTILVTSGFHPPEPDTLASDGIIEWLGSAEARALLDRLAVVVVPIVNPDGYARQTQGSNASGVNLFWDFRAEDEGRCPEAVALWRLAQTLAPRGYVDFHAYTFQLDKKPGPYCRPLSFYSDPAVRGAAEKLYTRLASAPGSLPVTGFSTYAPATLGSRLTSAFDTLTAAKYHLHLDEGEEGCRARGLAVFRALADEIVAAGLDARGTSRTKQGLVNQMRIMWAGFLRPTLGLVRRGRLGEITLRRSGLVMPEPVS